MSPFKSTSLKQDLRLMESFCHKDNSTCVSGLPPHHRCTWGARVCLMSSHEKPPPAGSCPAAMLPRETCILHEATFATGRSVIWSPSVCAGAPVCVSVFVQPQPQSRGAIKYYIYLLKRKVFSLYTSANRMISYQFRRLSVTGVVAKVLTVFQRFAHEDEGSADD